MEIRTTIYLPIITIIHFIFIIPISSNSCFQNKLFSLFGTGGAPVYPRLSPYQTDLTWASVQSPIINSSFYWRGFTISSPAKLISFDASLGAVDQTSATFFFNPTTNSEVYYIQFGILLLKSCTDAINIIFHQHNNCLLTPSQTAQTISINVGSPFLTDTANYIMSAIISSFTVTLPNSGSTRLTLKIQCQAISAGSSTQSIVLSTLQKTISKVAFTYIRVHIPSLRPVIYYQPYIYSGMGTNQITVPEVFDARNTFDCILGLKNLDTQYVGTVSLHSITFAISYLPDLTVYAEFSAVEMVAFQYSRICIGGSCPNGEQIDKTAATYICNPCDYYMPNCTACSAYNICNNCNKAYFLNSTTNATCVSCPINCLNCTFNGSASICSLCGEGYFIDSTSGQCYHCPLDCYACSNNSTCLKCYFGWIVNGGCTNQSDCTQVTANLSTINKCLKCSQNSSLVSGFCVNTIGCVSASSTNNVSTCLSCNASANFQNTTINNSCHCMANHIYSPTTNKSCIPCPSNCPVCEQGNGLIKCITCSANFTLYEPMNLSCIALQPNCISWEIISGVVSCLICANNSYKSVATSSFDYIRSCIPCLLDCSTCKSSRTCQTCLYDGWPVLGGCTRIPGCLEVKKNDLSTSKCLKCTQYDHYILRIGLCVNITGCVVPRMVDNKIICLSCDIRTFFKPVPIDSVCLCKDGYSLNQAKNGCRQICGDGIVYDVQCDDGNLQDGDGCSSLCTLEENFGCNVDIPLAPSRCIYLKYDITLAVTKISRKFTQNRGTFTFSITPNLNIYKKINFSSDFSFESNRTFIIESLSVVSNEITIEVIFYEDLEDYFASLRLNLTSQHFLQSKASVDFFMISDDSKLIFIKDLKKIKLCGEILQVICILSVCAFIVSSLVNKMMGLQTILPIQMIYLVHLINKQRYPCFGLLAFLGNTSFNYFYEGIYHPYVQQQCVATIFDKKKQAAPLWIMFGFMLPSLIFVFVFYLRKFILMKQKQISANQQKSQNPIENIVYYLYNHILFPYIIATFSIFWPILMIRQNLQHQYLAVLSLIQALILSLIFSFQFKEILLSYVQQTKLINFKKVKKWYVPVFLINLFIITLFVSLAFIDISVQMEPYILTIQLLYFLFILIIRPYDNILDNLVVIVNNAMTVTYLGWNINRNYDPELRTQENQFFAIYAIIIAISLMLILNLIRIVLQIVQLVRQRREKIKKVENDLQDFQSSVIAYKNDKQKSTKDEFQTSKQLDYMNRYGLNTRQFDKNTQIPLSFFEKSIKTDNLKNSKMRFLKNYLLHKQEYSK